jgi:hypothetical protein
MAFRALSRNARTLRQSWVCRLCVAESRMLSSGHSPEGAMTAINNLLSASSQPLLSKAIGMLRRCTLVPRIFYGRCLKQIRNNDLSLLSRDFIPIVQCGAPSFCLKSRTGSCSTRNGKAIPEVEFMYTYVSDGPGLSETFPVVETMLRLPYCMWP